MVRLGRMVPPLDKKKESAKPRFDNNKKKQITWFEKINKLGFSAEWQSEMRERFWGKGGGGYLAQDPQHMREDYEMWEPFIEEFYARENSLLNGDVAAGDAIKRHGLYVTNVAPVVEREYNEHGLCRARLLYPPTTTTPKNFISQAFGPKDEVRPAHEIWVETTNHLVDDRKFKKYVGIWKALGVFFVSEACVVPFPGKPRPVTPPPLPFRAPPFRHSFDTEPDDTPFLPDDDDIWALPNEVISAFQARRAESGFRLSPSPVVPLPSPPSPTSPTSFYGASPPPVLTPPRCSPRTRKELSPPTPPTILTSTKPLTPTPPKRVVVRPARVTFTFLPPRTPRVLPPMFRRSLRRRPAVSLRRRVLPSCRRGAVVVAEPVAVGRVVRPFFGRSSAAAKGIILPFAWAKKNYTQKKL